MTLIYNDGRPGHCDVTAVVLERTDTGLLVQFEDRADTTFVRHDDRAWWDHLRRTS